MKAQNNGYVPGWKAGPLASFIDEFIVPQRDRPKHFSGDVPWCRIEDINGMYLSGSKSGLCVTEQTIREMPLRLFPKNTVIVSCSADLGRCAILSRPLVTNQTFIGLVPSSAVDSRFLFYYMSSLAPVLNGMATGATIKYLSRQKFQDLSVCFPPLPEQQRIVGILDKAFAGIATAKANAEKNRRNARELFESELAAVFTAKDDSHPEKQLEEVCEDITVGHVGSMKTQYREKGIPFLRSQNIRPFRVSLDGLVFIDKAFHGTLRKSELRPGDVAIVRTGYPGTAAVIPESLPVANCSDLVIVRPGPSADPHYLALFFNSSFGKELVAGRLVGAAQKHFNVGAAKRVRIAFPPPAEQRRLVAAMNRLSDRTRQLEVLYERKLTALDALKKSLLHQAFSGQLSRIATWSRVTIPSSDHAEAPWKWGTRQ